MSKEIIESTSLGDIASDVETEVSLEEVLSRLDFDEGMVLREYIDLRELARGDRLILFGKTALDYYVVIEKTDLDRPITDRYVLRYEDMKDFAVPQDLGTKEARDAEYIIMGSCDGVNADYGSAIRSLEDILCVDKYPWLLLIKNETQVLETTSYSPISSIGIIRSN